MIRHRHQRSLRLGQLGQLGRLRRFGGFGRGALLGAGTVLLALAAGACGGSGGEQSADRGREARGGGSEATRPDRSGRSDQSGQSGQAGRPGQTQGGGGERAGRRPGGGRPGSGGPGGSSTAIPVEVAPAERASISSYIQGSGTLEADNEVDIVARTSGPIVELRTEEGRRAGRGELLARIEDDEARAQLEISRVTLEEAESAFERAESLKANQLISPEEYDRVRSELDTARAQFTANRLQVDYTQIRAPFAGLIVNRYVDRAQQVGPGAALFRISDFDPLLCPVQVPERELPKLAIGQTAYLTVEAWPDERFPARVLRLSPVVDSSTGTIKVTLDVDGSGQLRPGMFARVFLETDTHEEAVVIPKAALSLESLGDAVFVLDGGVARRRDVVLGFEEGESVEVLSGVAVGEEVIVVGQDGLADGTQVQVLAPVATETSAAAPAGADRQSSSRPATGSKGS